MRMTTRPNTRPIAWTIGLLAAVSALVAHAEGSAHTPSQAELAAAVSDRTYQGSMAAPDTAFSEYYASDGSIRSEGYTGKWRADDGMMCFQYGDKPERCFEVTVDGASMIMLNDDEVKGNGMLIEGNPHGY